MHKFAHVKRLATLFVLSVMLFNGAGFYIYYAFELDRIRDEAKQFLKSLPAEHLTVLQMTRTQYTDALVEEDEIRFRGAMYDVCRITIECEDVSVFCFRDEKEESALAFLSELVTKPIEQKRIPVSVINFIRLNFLVHDFSVTFDVQHEEVIHRTVYFFCFTDIFNRIETPPPRA
jgi:hypothetical protein